MNRTRELLILRPDNIGDVVLFSGCLEHIRRLYPDYRITLAVQPHIVNLVELCPWVDRVTGVRVRRRGRSLLSAPIQAVARGVDRLRSVFGNRYEVVLFPLKSPDPDQLVLLSNHAAPEVFGLTGCCVNAPEGGYPAALAPDKLCTHVHDISGADPWRHELATNLEYLEFLGSPVKDVRDIGPVVWLSDADHAFSRFKDSAPSPIVGVFPCSFDPRKNWGLDNYVNWAKSLEMVGTFVIFGAAADRNMASALADSLHEARPSVAVINMVGQTTLRQLAAGIGTCDILFSVDSAGLHLGIAAGIPTVGIMGGWHFGRFAPWGDPARHRIITHHLPCFGCNLMCHRQRHECLHAVTPSEVAACCNELLGVFYHKQPSDHRGE
ncbi:glycosyltransferase family 9 protein [Oryzomonas rubra]|uniref:glycosyltransferase family 9 protein n=1 Tax=Oryzomonas rubra TaxID=2509454 RepID=UPI00165DE3DB